MCYVLFRGVPTHRGWVKKIRFAPGKGNQKLLVMYTDGAEVWDTKEVRDFFCKNYIICVFIERIICLPGLKVGHHFLQSLSFLQ